MFIGKPVSIKKLQEQLQNKEKYHGSVSSLLRLVKSLGFIYKKEDNRRALMEKPVIADKRRRFLTSYMANANLAERKPCIFLDETWIFSNGSFRKSWQDKNLKSVRKETGEGYRLIYKFNNKRFKFWTNVLYF